MKQSEIVKKLIESYIKSIIDITEGDIFALCDDDFDVLWWAFDELSTAQYTEKREAEENGNN